MKVRRVNRAPLSRAYKRPGGRHLPAWRALIVWITRHDSLYGIQRYTTNVSCVYVRYDQLLPLYGDMEYHLEAHLIKTNFNLCTI